MGRSIGTSVRRGYTAADWLISVNVFLLGLVGLFLLLTTNQNVFWQQMAFILAGTALLWILSHMDSALLWWLAPYGYILSVLFLIAAYLGDPIRGASRWIQVAGIQIQPSEFAKPFMLLATGWALVMFSPRKAKNLWIHGLLFVVPFLLIFKQPDLGTAIIYAVSWVAMMIAGGFSIPLLIAGLAAVLLGIPQLWPHLAPYQQNRILTFLNPGLDPKGAGYNAIQAMIAVGSGQVFGRGLGRGTQSHLRFLPEFHTDFIFATLVEELGFVGGAVLLVLYAVLLWQIIMPHVQGKSENPFLFFYSIGLFAILFVQVVINAGMNMGIIPVTGITLPFVSYGGSSILSLCVAVGFLLALRKSAARESTIAMG